MSSHQVAAIEAYEEAGLTRKISSKRIGCYRHRKQKGMRKIDCEVEVYPLKVKRQMQSWPERGQRQFAWLPAQQAVQWVYKAELCQLIARFAATLSRCQ